jgi:hypothetical protein
MWWFADKRKDEKPKEVFWAEVHGNTVIVQFKEEGKQYRYHADNVFLTDNPSECQSYSPINKELLIYSFEQICYRCHKPTRILTYLLYEKQLCSQTVENLTFPWDKPRLNQEKSGQQTLYHMFHEEIEFYPIAVLGDNSRLDELLLHKYPQYIRIQYSKTQNRRYPMNICQHCQAKQGQYFIYVELNRKIQKMQNISIYDKIPL